MNAANAEAVDAGDGGGPGDDEATRPLQRGAADPDSDSEAAAADRLRDRAERVRRRELDTAVNRLAADGEVTAAERQALAALAANITDALVEQWASRLTGDEVDAEAVLALLSE
ncbi:MULTISPECIES: hypothetical protein [Halorussus]|uniref:hypothetical protein n=1 Tax=Halorussus TaxID=1070314 RepID=UPI000E20E07C|nr:MULTISPECIES: hypothetical protein [Halorussus]NHN60266.1 hypothetical protein [Halorussus sp. JP-T4]